MVAHENAQGSPAKGGAAPADWSTPQTHLRHDDVFDWESYISHYKGRAKLQRLHYLATHCPELRIPCADALIEAYKSQTTDTRGYQAAYTIRNTFPDGHETLLPRESRAEPDRQWIDETDRKNRSDGEKLDLELRNYQNNLIKESIRMAHRDLGDFFRTSGNLSDALKCYTRTRDFCSTSEHVMEMCLNAIDVSLELGDWASIATYVSKAETVLESYNPSNVVSKTKSMSGHSSSVQAASKSGTTSGADAIGALFRAGGSAGASSSTFRPTHRDGEGEAGGRGAKEGGHAREIREIGNRLMAANAIANLRMGRYEAAARAFLTCDATVADALAQMISPADIALYTTLCALARFDRQSLRTSIVDKASFKPFLEQEPHARELLESFWACDYKKGLGVLQRWRTRHELDMHLAPHLERLKTLIVQRAVQQFLVPFDAVSVKRMAAAFGWEEGDMAIKVLQMIEEGTLDVRIDWVDKIVYANKADERTETFEEAIKVAKERVTAQDRLLLRTEMVQQGLVAKANYERVRS